MANLSVVELPEKRPGKRIKGAKEKILDIAEALIVKYGTNGISYQHIADEVGIRKASIHHHFPSKTDLIIEIGERRSKEFFDRLNKIMVSNQNPIEKLRSYFSLFKENFIFGCGASISFFGMLGAELESQDDRVAGRVRNFFVENISRLAAIIDEGRLSADDNVETMAAAIFSTLEGAMIIVRATGDVDKYGEIIECLLHMISANAARA